MADVDQTIGSLIEQCRDGNPRAMGQLISVAEGDGPSRGRLARLLRAGAPRTIRVVGVTGPPGVGKSTVTEALARTLRARGLRLGVLAVDPSSPLSGGALLGDRIRMRGLSGSVFVRSMASRGQIGGLSLAVPLAVRILDVAGLDTVIVETVGVGQSEYEIESVADTTLVLFAPGLGDGIQAVKAGLVEMADVFVVNKADRPGADQVARDLKAMQSLSRAHPAGDAWRPPITLTTASTGDGIDQLLHVIDDHHEWLSRSGEWGARELRRAENEIASIALAELRDRVILGNADSIRRYAGDVTSGAIDAYSAAMDLLGQATEEAARTTPHPPAGGKER
jgi:LAO/AO transport system kinase